MTHDRYLGTMLGLALGDAMGAPFEGGPLERLAWRLIGRTRQGHMRWTDDTRMSLDLAESILACSGLDTNDLAQRFAASYHWSRGYGPSAARTLKRIARGTPWHQANRLDYREGSFGNGAAMRAPVIGLYLARQLDLIDTAARQSAEITHAHPLGMSGAALIARATVAALADSDPEDLLKAAAANCTEDAFCQRFQIAAGWLADRQAVPGREVTRLLGNGIAAAQSCVTAVYVAARFQQYPFEEMLGFIKLMRGDVDTISSMAGALWGASRGAEALPAGELARLEQAEEIKETATRLFELVARRNSNGPD